MAQGIAELNALPPIKARARLVNGDALTVCTLCEPEGWFSTVIQVSLFMAFDPVANDAAAMRFLGQLPAAEGIDPAPMADQAAVWLAKATELGVGTAEGPNTRVAEVGLS